MSEEQKRILEQQLWNIANTLRGKMGADEFRDYILGFIFYKYLSEKIIINANELLQSDYTALADNDENITYLKEELLNDLGYFLLPSQLFSAIAKKGNDGGEETSSFILDDLTTIFTAIEQSTIGTASEDEFYKLFADIDLSANKLGKTPTERNKVIATVISHLDNIDFNLSDTDADVLGDAYEYLIAQFASGAGKKAGEFYTPQQVAKLLAKLVTANKTKLGKVYDPTCGSGSLLLRIKKEVDEVGKFYGQESNATTYNLCRMNMLMHDVKYDYFDIKQEDTLEHPQHLEHRFDAIVANPPFSHKWSANSIHLSDDRFSQYGRLAPASAADFAFVQHMIYQLADHGVMAVVLPHGVLFRGASEGVIRKYLVEEKNYLDTIISLPKNLFYGTSIPTCVLVFKKCREDDKHILFIDASNDLEKVKAQNFLPDSAIEKILDVYNNRRSIDKYSYLATLEEVRNNEYNLNIPRYVNTFEEEEEIDLQEVADKIKALDSDITSTQSKIADFCKQLNIPTPF